MPEILLHLVAQRPDNPLWLPFLLSGAVFGALCLAAARQPLGGLIPRLDHSAAIDLLLWFTCRVAITVVSVGLVVLGLKPFAAQGASAPPSALVVLGVAHLLIADGSFWVAHWARHRVDTLWQFHAVHHSARSLNPITAFRRHPIEAVFVDRFHWLFRVMLP